MSKAHDDIVAEAKKRFAAAESRESQNRQRLKDAFEFSVELKQWPEELKRQREADEEACPVFDKLNQYVRRVVNEMRANLPQLKFRPIGDGSDVQVARVYDGLCRHVIEQCQAETTFQVAGESAVRGGYGAWRVLTEYCDDGSFDNQDIIISPIPNSFSVVFGPHADSTGADAPYVFVFEDMDRDEFKLKWPKAKAADFESQKQKEGDAWATEKTVRVAEYYKVVEEQKDLHLLDNGQTMLADEYENNASAALAAYAQSGDPGAAPPIPQVVKSRKTTIKTIKWYKLTGAEVLEERDIVGDLLPVIKVVGNYHVLPDGKTRTSGLVECGMDPQRLHNYAQSKFIQQVALAPTAPFVGVVGQFKTRSKEWQVANRKNFAVLEYDLVNDETGKPLPAPQRQTMPGVPPGWQQLTLNTEHGVEAAVGMYGASVGGPARERSGVALETQEQSGDMVNLHYGDNLARSIRQTGKVLLQWFPIYYNSERVLHIVGEDGEHLPVFLNPNQQQAVQRSPRGMTYRLDVGKYDVSITTGPSYHTKREEGARLMSEAMKSNPQLLQLIGDLYFRVLDVPYADKIADRLKAMLPPQIQQSEQNQHGQQVPPQIQAMMQHIQQTGQMLQQKEQQLMQVQQQVKTEGENVGAQKIQLEALKHEIVAERKVLDATAKQLFAEIELERAKLTQLTIPKEQVAPTANPDAVLQGQP